MARFAHVRIKIRLEDEEEFEGEEAFEHLAARFVKAAEQIEDLRPLWGRMAKYWAIIEGRWFDGEGFGTWAPLQGKYAWLRGDSARILDRGEGSRRDLGSSGIYVSRGRFAGADEVSLRSSLTTPAYFLHSNRRSATFASDISYLPYVKEGFVPMGRAAVGKIWSSWPPGVLETGQEVPGRDPFAPKEGPNSYGRGFRRIAHDWVAEKLKEQGI